MALGSRAIVLFCSALIGFGYAARVQADPIQVTSGGVFVYWDSGPTSAAMSADRFSIFGDGFGGGALAWEAGHSGNLDGSFSFSQTLFISFPAVVDGISYPVAFLSGTLRFTTMPFVVPPPDGSVGLISTPFTMSGFVTGYTNGERTGTPMFGVFVTGAGRASTTALVIPGTSSYVSRNGIDYQLAAAADPPAAAPEPASLLLLGSGAAGLLWRRKGRRRAG
jgi:hypothetical protein